MQVIEFAQRTVARDHHFMPLIAAHDTLIDFAADGFMTAGRAAAVNALPTCRMTMPAGIGHRVARGSFLVPQWCVRNCNGWRSRRKGCNAQLLRFCEDRARSSIRTLIVATFIMSVVRPHADIPSAVMRYQYDGAQALPKPQRSTPCTLVS